MQPTRILLLALAASLATAAHAAEWDQEFRPPNVTNTADFFVEGPGTTAFVFERVGDGNDVSGDEQSILRRIDRATTQVYAVPLGVGVFPEPMLASATRVCASFTTTTESGVQCFSTATGARVLNFATRPANVGYEIWAVLPGAVRVAEFSNLAEGEARRDGRVLDILNDGSVRVIATLAGPSFDRVTTANASGAFFRISGGLPLPTVPETFYLHDANGNQVGEPIPSPFNQTTQRSRTIVLPDGSAAVLNRRRVGNTNVWSILRISETGEVRWQRDYPGNVGYPQIQYTGEELLISYGAFPVLFTAEDDDLREDIPLNSVLISVNPLTGAEAWRTTFPAALNGPYLVEGRGNELLHVQQTRAGITLRRFDRGTGVLVAIDRRSCGSAFCEIQNMWIDDEGGLQLGVAYAADQNRERWALLREDDPFADVIGTYDVGSSAIEGAWYSPTTTGQGLVIDRIENNNTIFATWFTHVVDPAVEDVTGLRWFTVQGPITGDGTTITNLGIFENRGGTFASGSVTAVRVGTARLVGLDCNTLRLDYDFDAGTNIPDGVTTLVRATPANVGCTFPYVPFRTPRNGFDSAQTGHWFSPTAPGQGFSFVVTPATSTANGSLTGAWFTFDAVSDDPRSQHWFTFAGLITPNTPNGSVEVTLYRSTGGAFESQPALEVDAAGTATVTFTACDRATFEYRFDGGNEGGFARRSGTIELVGEACD